MADARGHGDLVFCDAGLAEERRFDDHPPLYEFVDHEEHRDHLICSKCSKIVAFENEEIERLQEVIAKEHGFKLTHHRMELYGICSDCQALGHS